VCVCVCVCVRVRAVFLHFIRDGFFFSVISIHSSVNEFCGVGITVERNIEVESVCCSYSNM
jgi:hypothetical protein